MTWDVAVSIVFTAITLLCIGICVLGVVDRRRMEREEQALIDAIEAETLDVRTYKPTDLMALADAVAEPKPTLRVERITVPRVALHPRCIDARVDRRYHHICRHCRPALDMPMERAS